MAITGTGAVEREQSVLLIQINGIWYPIGEDNESMERTRNNTVTQTKNVLSKTKTTVGLFCTNTLRHPMSSRRNCTAFSAKENAEQYMKKVKAAGFGAFIVEVDNNA